MRPNIEPEPIGHLDPVAARMILAALPDPIREAFERRAAAIDYPIEAVLEMAIAGFLDGECLSFSDCQPRY
jgi:hypothetical protein